MIIREINQDTQDKKFNCQEECSTQSEEYILPTSSKINIWLLPVTLYTQQTTLNPIQLTILEHYQHRIFELNF